MLKLLQQKQFIYKYTNKKYWWNFETKYWSNFEKYIYDGYQQQQPIVITQCFMCFTQSSDDYTILFNL